MKLKLLLITLVLTLLGCDPGSSENSKRYYIQETVPTKYFDVSVNRVLEGTVVNPGGLDRIDAPPGTKYIVLDVTIKNISSEARIFDSGELRITIDGKDLKYDKSEIVLAKGFINFGNINPLISETGYIVFNVPESVGDGNNVHWIPARSKETIYLRRKPVEGGVTPLESFGIETADYKALLKYMNEDQFYSDVPPPNCQQPIRGDLKILCSRKDFQNIAWITRRLQIYAEENATKNELDHKTSYAQVYVSNCTDETCMGKQLAKEFYSSIDDSGKSDLIPSKK